MGKSKTGIMKNEHNCRCAHCLGWYTSDNLLDRWPSGYCDVCFKAMKQALAGIPVKYEYLWATVTDVAQSDRLRSWLFGRLWTTNDNEPQHFYGPDEYRGYYRYTPTENGRGTIEQKMEHCVETGVTRIAKSSLSGS